MYEDNTYGDAIADVYDRFYGPPAPEAIDLLAELAGAGPALELGIGTGRYALPLQARGVAVHGIDASTAMLRRLASKAGGADIPVRLGSFADFSLGERFSLIYVVFNTFFALLTQEEQVQCFASVARHLAPNGVFLIEAFVPDLSRFQREQSLKVVNIATSAVKLDAARLDRARQRITAAHIYFDSQGVHLYPVQLRYAWPSELDLMARLAGLRLRERWSGWQRQAFTSDSGAHISVYAA